MTAVCPPAIVLGGTHTVMVHTDNETHILTVRLSIGRTESQVSVQLSAPACADTEAEEDYVYDEVSGRRYHLSELEPKE